jgi:hypothetical protein
MTTPPSPPLRFNTPDRGRGEADDSAGAMRYTAALAAAPHVSHLSYSDAKWTQGPGISRT